VSDSAFNGDVPAFNGEVEHFQMMDEKE